MTPSPVGQETVRVDGRLKVTGTAQYSGDYPAANMSHAYLVTSTIARGTVSHIDTAAALDAPGVLRVYTAGDTRLSLYPVVAQFRSLVESYIPLSDTAVRFHGQAIAMVVAESFEQARDAAALVTVTYDEQTPRASFADEPREPAGPALDGSPSSVQHLAPGVNSIDEALDASEVVVEAEYGQQTQHQIGMEPHSVLAVWDGDQVTVYSGAQIPTVHSLLLSQRLGVLPTQVRLVGRYVGGGFGSRVILWSDAPLAAAAARELGRPVKLTFTREQMFTLVGHRQQASQHVRLGASRGGVLEAISHRTDSVMPVIGGFNLTPAHATSDTFYSTPNLHIEVRSVRLDMPLSRAMRAPNEAAGAFALETAMDELAVATGVDPVELRLRNYATVSPSTGLPWSSKHLDECYRDGARRFGWSDRSATPRARVDGQWLYGTGMATAAYPAGVHPVSVRIRLLDDDTAVVSTATSDLGTGGWTMVAVVGADALGIPVGRVTPEIGDSALPSGAPAVGSSATHSTVPVVVAAARNTIAALKELAVTHSGSPWHGLNAEGLRWEEGRLHGGEHSMTFGELLTELGSRGVDATADSPGGAPEEYEYNSFGAHFCEVRVNRFTGETRVTRFTTVADAGRVINARAARSQIVGGVVFGIGHALLEHNPIEPATGRLAASTLADYLVPVNADIPDIDVHLLDRPDPHLTGPLGDEGEEVGTRSLGARGLGEIGTVGSAAAVGNAVFNATGTRIRRLPITPDKLL
ncbi:xanthine dehydrogenase family protein molybdopterin-binding subunit [Streptomyces radicis]|uniref:Xanthine dehydrogenase family protein molybdopterin-binding subunit n=1 Tax=Streptomyces radicis TaxID=1750517 RepID=A0A3A9WJD8_9ACTN|nr:xanthine dehydrogenase family protein molybdopterin-binding subunit [Streptomyces radicis]RKN12879.1 xanthine dehydrogenase family protein molybdopterin-binding subunit [Streptomyces radicis]RKN27356.1 xanthine dehydrogenase family protein molybdopterin-binding subunit [Streptomyces radicis]